MSRGGGDSDARAVVLEEHFDASTLPSLRERVTACVVAAGMPVARAMDVTLTVHELAANAVRHGAGSGWLLILAVGGGLRCQVSDAGTSAGPWPLRHGHGLWIAQQVADQFTVSHGDDGSVVTASFGWRTARG